MVFAYILICGITNLEKSNYFFEVEVAYSFEEIFISRKHVYLLQEIYLLEMHPNYTIIISNKKQWWEDNYDIEARVKI